MSDENEMSFGQKAVGLSFNPSGDPIVNMLKASFSDILDDMDALRQQAASPEVKRMLSIAITEAQTAQMWAVKAATWRD